MNLYIPLRIKFLLLILVSFVFAMGAMTISSRNLFLEDKESYLYEDMLKSVENDSEFINVYIDNTMILTKTIFSNVLLKKIENADAVLSFPKEFFIDNPSLIDFHLYRYGANEFLLEDEVENSGIKQLVNDHVVLFKESDKMHPFLKQVVDRKTYIDFYRSQEGTIQLRIGFFDPNSRIVGFFRYALSMHLSKINFGSTFTKGLMSPEGLLLYKSLSYLDERNSRKDRDFALISEQINKEGSSSGVKSLLLGDEKHLVAFKKFPNYELQYVSLIAEDQAYASTQVLILRMIRIAIFAFIFVLALVYFLSNSFTKSLKDLISATKEAAEGNYRQSINFHSGDEVGVLVKNFNGMIDQVKFMTKRLTDANQNLENKIKERTQDLKLSNDFINAMINSLDQGLFVFNRKGNILPIHTKACQLFFNDGFDKRNVKELLPFDDPETAEMTIKAMFEEKIPFHSVALLAPKNIGQDRHEIDQEEFFRASLKYFAMRSKEGDVQFVVVVATDISKEFRAEIQSETNKAYIERVLKMIKSKNNFVTFLSELELNIQSIKDGMDYPEEVFNFNKIMVGLHSIKGMAGQYEAKNLARYVHECETELSNFKDKGNEERQEYLSELGFKVKEIEDMVLEIKKEAKIVIGKSVIDGIIREEVERPNLLKFRENLKAKLRDQFPELILDFENKFLKIPVKDYFRPFELLVEDLSSQLGKKVKPFEYINGDLPVDKRYYENVMSNFVHLFRNIVDHGIEVPSKRTEKGKDESGKIQIEFKVVNRRIELNISDDGGGIDPERVRAKLKENGAKPDILDKPDNEIIEHIFDPNFSTKVEVSDISGRGVGMDAVKQAVSEIGGAVKISSTLGSGTTFRFRMPLE